MVFDREGGRPWGRSEDVVSTTSRSSAEPDACGGDPERGPVDHGCGFRREHADRDEQEREQERNNRHADLVSRRTPGGDVAARDNNVGCYRKAASGEGPEELLHTHPGQQFGLNLTDWSMDGRFLLYGSLQLGGNILYALPSQWRPSTGRTVALHF